MQFLNETLVEKWKDILDVEGMEPIKDPHKRSITAQLLENTERDLETTQSHGDYTTLMEDVVPGNSVLDGNITNFDPVLISLIRRAAPNLIAYDVCGVQPMTGPTGLIFAMRPMFSNTSNAAIGETWYDEVNTNLSTVVSGANTLGLKNVGTIPGNNSTSANLAETGLYNYAQAMATAQAEALGTDSNTEWPQMTFTIDRVTVTARSRKLKSEYTMEFAQDLKAIHGLDAEGELSGILSTEILSEINREVIRTINVTAVQGARENTTNDGFFDMDTDANGRWSVEKFKGLMFHVEREANRIAKETRRGKGNLLICSSDVASALQMAGVLDYAPALSGNSLQVDDTGVTFAGVLNGRYKVFIDPYADGLPNFAGLNYMTVGYKGPNAYDAGLFYAPYVPLQMVRAVDPASFHPKIGFATRYGMVSNPYAQGGTLTNQGALLKDSNVYYRRVLIQNIM